MEFSDPVHGHIHLREEELPVVEHPFFQRLRSILQMGLSQYVFPGATHSRYLHSLGTMEIASRAFARLFGRPENKHLWHNAATSRSALEATLRLACLLHDLGHAPLSHATESIMPALRALNIPPTFLNKTDLCRGKVIDRQATHEDYTVKAIVDSSFTSSLKKVEQKFGVRPEYIADLILGETRHQDFFTINGLNYFPLLHQLVSSELDCDRMDYLLRDGYFCGVSYGTFDLDWMIDSLEICPQGKDVFLGISENAVASFDDFLLGRYHMVIQVYFHYKSVCLEQLLFRYFQTAQEYVLPADIEAYMLLDDHDLMKTLRRSKNPYAIAIIQNRIPDKIFESFNPAQLKILKNIEAYLKKEKIEYLRCSSRGRLSKYGTNYPFALKVVRRTLAYPKPIYCDIGQATELFEKFSSAHAVSRLHVNFSELTRTQQNKIMLLMQGKN